MTTVNEIEQLLDGYRTWLKDRTTLKEIEGGEWAVEPKHGKHTGSWGGAYGGANAHCAPGVECKHNPACKN